MGLNLAAAGSLAVADAFDIEQTANTIFKSFTRNDALETALEIDPDAANAVQDFFIALLRPTWGMDVGYAALATQSEASAASPQTGILLENMFTGTRAMIDRSFGVDMQAAAELYFRVKSAHDLTTAQSRQEVLMALDSVIPGVRLSDSLIPALSAHDRSLVSATNLGVRLCVLGGPLPLDAGSDWIERLENFSVAMLDQDKQQIAVKRASMAVHPLDAVLATRDALLERGIETIDGDILAIGTLTEHHEIASLTRLRVEFEGLAADQQVFVYMGFR